MIEEKVKIKQKRNFSDVINVAFAFIKQEYKSFWKVILLYAGIPTLAYAIFNTVYLRNVINVWFKLIQNQGAPEEFMQNFGPQLLIMSLLSTIMYLFYYGLTHSYIVLYSQNNEAKHPREVWHLFTKKFLSLFGYILLTGLFMGIGFIIIVAIFAIAGRAPVFIAIGGLLSVILFVYLSVVISLLLVIKVNEKVDYFMALGRCFNLIKSHWWETFGLIIIAFIIAAVIQNLINFPVASYIGVKGILSEDTSIGVVPAILTSLCSTIGILLVTPLTSIFIAFQYFSLVEHKDNTSLFDRIDNINSNQ